MNLLYDIAMSLVGMNIPYIWGSKCPLVGLDCSGVNQFILQSVGMGPKETLNADSQYHYWLTNGIKVEPCLGAMVFFGTPELVEHTGFCIDNKRMVEAYNGSRTCNSRAVAALIGASVRISPIARRTDLIACLTPQYDL